MASLSHDSAGSGSGFPRSARATHGPSCRWVTNIHSSIVTVREDFLRALLNADLVGFHTFDYARHFMSSCSFLLGVSSHARRGHICIDYHGRGVLVSILLVGVDMGQLRAAVATSGAATKAKEIAEAYRGQTLMVGVDNVDLFKGVDLKLLALVKLFDTEPGMRGKVVLVRINKPGATAVATCATVPPPTAASSAPCATGSTKSPTSTQCAGRRALPPA
ncbi:hypothetical protein ACP70R_002713 [Stipagrostis hirtigluma subsp. patula]